MASDGDADGADAGCHVAFGRALVAADAAVGRRQRVEAVNKGMARVEVPVWKQEVVDEAGRRRFHGAFTGGFSAGYFNTVGSKEGWTPGAFVSSRSNRAQQRQQRTEDFMDDDEREEAERETLRTAAAHDSFGFTAAELSKREVSPVSGPGVQRSGAGASLLGAGKLQQQQQKNQARVVSGLIGVEEALASALAPALDGVGVQLLRKMGWREGRSVGPDHIAASDSVRREGRRAFVALSQPPADVKPAEPHRHPQSGSEGGRRRDEEDGDAVDLKSEMPAEESGTAGRSGGEGGGEEHESSSFDFVKRAVEQPKSDLFGLGFDPFQNAEDVRAARDKVEALQGRPVGLGGSMGGGSGGSSDGGGASRAFGSAGGTQGKVARGRAGAVRMAGGFGVGALEDVGAEDADIYDQGFDMLSNEIGLDDDEADEDEEMMTRLRMPSVHRGTTRSASLMPKSVGALEGHGQRGKEHRTAGGTLAGFRHASAAPPKIEVAWYPPPSVPLSFTPHHVFPPPPASTDEVPHKQHDAHAHTGAPPKQPASPPSDPSLASAIDGVAAFVAVCGDAFESVARERHDGDPRFAFLTRGGLGRQYYEWRLWHEKQKRQEQQQRGSDKEQIHGTESTLGDRGVNGSSLAMNSAKVVLGRMSADERGQVLGERPLPRTSPEENQSATHGGTGREACCSAAGVAAGAAGAAAAPPPPSVTPPAPTGAAAELVALMSQRFQSAGTEGSSGGGSGGFTASADSAAAAKAAAVQKAATLHERAPVVPRRSSEAWRPMPLLCKRFNVANPYAGQAAPSDLHRSSKVDSFTAAALEVVDRQQPQQQPQHPQQQQLLLLPPAPPRMPTTVMASDANATAAVSVASLENHHRTMFQSWDQQQQPVQRHGQQQQSHEEASDVQRGEAVEAAAKALCNRPLDLFKPSSPTMKAQTTTARIVKMAVFFGHNNRCR